MSADNKSPLQQFEITPLIELPSVGGYDISFTNSSLFMILTVAAIILFIGGGIRKHAMVPGRWQSMVEMTYEFIANMVSDNVGREGRRYFPFIFTLFLFVLFGNLWGMMPYSFTITSHVIVTFALAAFIFVGVTVIALVKHGTKFFGFFLPDGTPGLLIPLIYPIEVMSYLARPISLSVRLAANMIVGHTLLKVIAGFVVMMGVIWGTIPFVFLIGLTGFEFFIAFLHAYIFTILTCIYLNDALHLH